MRISRLLLAGLVSVGIVAVGVLLLWQLGSSAPSRKPFSTTAFAPRDSQVFLAFNTDPTSRQWLTVSRGLASVHADQPVRDALGKALQENHLKWDKDIVAVLGDEAFLAITDYSKVQEQKGAVAVLELRDQKKAQKNFLDLLRSSAQDADEVVLEENYQGLKITYAQEKFGPGRNRSQRDFGALA